MNQQTGFTRVQVLSNLVGKPWDGVAMAYLRSLRPNRVRVMREGGAVTSDFVLWRVTVWIDAAELVLSIEQEVEVDLPDGVESAHDLERRLERDVFQGNEMISYEAT